MSTFLREKIKFIICGLLLAIAYTIYYYNTGISSVDSLRVMGLFSLIQLCYILYGWHSLTKNYYDAYIVFICACYAFNLGQPILEIFNAVAPERSIITHYNLPLDTYITATYISTYFILSFHIGAIVSCKEIRIRHQYGKPSYKFQLKSIFKVATIFAILSFPAYIYNTIINMIIAATVGYDGIYMQDTGSIRLFQLLGDYYVPALICLFFASEALHKRRRIVFSVIILTVFFPPLYIGGRSNAMIIVAILGLIYVFFHRIKAKQIIIFGGVAYFLLIIFAVIASNRGDSRRSLESFTTLGNEKVNPALFSLTEIGGSIQPLIHCLNIIPDKQDYRYGESYLYATTTVIPNIGFWEVHPATKYANLGNWLRDYLGIPYGPGFSIVAEAYYNFGWYGFIMMFILGYVLSKFFSNVNRMNVYANPLKFIMGIVLLWLTISMVRNSFEFAVRALVYYYLPMYWFMKYQYKRIQYKNNNSRMMIITGIKCRDSVENYSRKSAAEIYEKQI